MIFVTVGHQMPFDRLVRVVDEWAGREGRADVVAQIGEGGYRPRHLEAVARVPPAEFAALMDRAEAVVAHAGMGTIITALRLGRPLLVMPRRAALGETRSDHQVDTARHFAEAGCVLAAADERELLARLPELPRFRPRLTLGTTASPELIERLREFAAAA